jgi:hypothetical protein
MSQKWKITFSYAAGPIPKGQTVFVTTENVSTRPTEADIKEALRSVGIETDKPWTGIGGTYKVDYGN